MQGQDVIRLPARFDFSHHRRFIEEMERLLQQNELKTIQVDFTQVQFIDSSALGMLVLLNKNAQAKAISVQLLSCRGPVLEVLKMARMDKLFSLQ